MPAITSTVVCFNVKATSCWTYSVQWNKQAHTARHSSPRTLWHHSGKKSAMVAVAQVLVTRLRWVGRARAAMGMIQ